ncbi:MAG: indole-3-glycerol phosphate synthase TrpC [Deltaproteobacteria bacterium]|nr:indole-3-glycerol phosphate synthase TrpC [Deltaproteobacteria bacterium]
MFLDEIAQHVRGEVARRNREVPPSSLRDRPLFHLPRRGFLAALQGEGRRIIAELKRASPSQGVIREDFDPVGIARAYAAGGASAISVLTEERFFQGSLRYLEQIRGEVSLPLLCKDFVLDSYQLVEAKSFGADAVLLIAALLDPHQLREFAAEARALSLDTLVEVHTEAELEQALEAGARLIGINNRNLKTFEVSLETTERLAPKVPPEVTIVCESGIDQLEQIRRVERLGVHVFLIGEALMRAPDPVAKLRELLS